MKPMHVNVLTLIGSVGTAIEFRADGEGGSTCSFSVLTEIDGERIWHRVRAWGYRAKVCNRRLRKGTLVELEGPQTYIKSGRGLKPELRALVIKVLR